MGLLDRLFGRNREPDERREPAAQSAYEGRTRPLSDEQAGALSDEQAIERYRYMLRTAPPETIEQAHEEAFAKLTPEQRRMVLQELTAALPERERAAAAQNPDDPKALARMATRAELREPGIMERTFGGMGWGMSGGMFAGSIFSSLAAGFVGSMIAHQFFDSMYHDHGYGGDVGDQTGPDGAAGVQESDPGWGTDVGADGYGSDVGGDFGGDFGDFGGDFGADV